MRMSFTASPPLCDWLDESERYLAAIVRALAHDVVRPCPKLREISRAPVVASETKINKNENRDEKKDRSACPLVTAIAATCKRSKRGTKHTHTHTHAHPGKRKQNIRRWWQAKERSTTPPPKSGRRKFEVCDCTSDARTPSEQSPPTI